MPAAISGPTGMPLRKATPMTVPMMRPGTTAGWFIISGTPRPASQATKMPAQDEGVFAAAVGVGIVGAAAAAYAVAEVGIEYLCGVVAGAHFEEGDRRT